MSVPRGNHPRENPPNWRKASPHEPAAAEALPPWRNGRPAPLIAITADVSHSPSGRLQATCSLTYCEAVAAAGGIPVVLPPILRLAGEHAKRFDGFVLTGGDDLRTDQFGEPLHPKSSPIHPDRQAYETALLRALEERAAAPVLGVCMGMQLMALMAGGKLLQHMPDELPTADRHVGDASHSVRTIVEGGGGLGPIGEAPVTSNHHQAVTNPGKLRVIAVSEDGVIEAIDDPKRPFYLGVQWHPERTPGATMGSRLFAKLVEACKRSA